jgi:hypothetical protein
MLVDISERKKAENQQKILIDELNHRVKNTLATVQSLGGQTARHADGLHDFFDRFEARLLTTVLCPRFADPAQLERNAARSACARGADTNSR